jgi:hypothetical protein
MKPFGFPQKKCLRSGRQNSSEYKFYFLQVTRLASVTIKEFMNCNEKYLMIYQNRFSSSPFLRLCTIDNELKVRNILGFYYSVFSFVERHLNIPTVSEVIKAKFRKFHSSLSSSQANAIGKSLSTPSHPLNPPRQLRRQWPGDLL